MSSLNVLIFSFISRNTAESITTPFTEIEYWANPLQRASFNETRHQ